ncbi:MAG: hypothetical protein FWD13_13440, partial [Treponema sp.]|nr:hypothetical protein [Treponema sp.]
MEQEKKINERRSSGYGLDVFVILFCFLGFAVCIFLFQRDLYATFHSLSIPPAGNVTVKYNTVQRRVNDRVIWDRLFAESPVYSGDLIRIAKLSGAILSIDEN